MSGGLTDEDILRDQDLAALSALPEGVDIEVEFRRIVENHPNIEEVKHIQSTGSIFGLPVVRCDAMLIPTTRADETRSFSSRMGAISRKAASFAEDLFDSTGRLQAKFSEDPVFKETGVWGPELNATGGILVIEKLYVESFVQRKGIGSGILPRVKDSMKEYQVDFIFTKPGAFLEDTDGTVLGIYQNTLIAERFWRSQAFRRVGNTSWFVFAYDMSHPSHQLAAENDLEIDLEGTGGSGGPNSSETS